jgi:hypothetical protein
MKRSPKTEFKIVAVGLLIIAAALLAGALSVVPAHHNIFDQPWQRTFVNEERSIFARLHIG